MAMAVDTPSTSIAILVEFMGDILQYPPLKLVNCHFWQVLFSHVQFCTFVPLADPQPETSTALPPFLGVIRYVPPFTMPPPLLLLELLLLLLLLPLLTVTLKFCVLCAPQLFVYVAVAVHEPVRVTVCSRDEPDVPHPLQLHEPPLVGCGPNFTDAPEATVTLLVCCHVPPFTCI